MIEEINSFIRNNRGIKEINIVCDKETIIKFDEEVKTMLVSPLPVQKEQPQEITNVGGFFTAFKYIDGVIVKLEQFDK